MKLSNRCEEHIEVINYENKYRDGLLALFYKSNFYNKKEFDYVRIPKDWIFRYSSNKENIIKLAVFNNKVIGSLGLQIGCVNFRKKLIKIGCFVDYCILPEYLKEHDTIFWHLFKDMEEDAKKNEVAIILGWEFLENFKKHEKLFKEMGFNWVKGVNWVSSGISIKGVYPYDWKCKIPHHWKIIFDVMKLNHKLRGMLLKHLPDGVEIEYVRCDKMHEVYKFINEFYSETDVGIYLKENGVKNIKNGSSIYAIIAKKGSEIVGVLTYMLSAWSGWMFGKPAYDKNWQIFYGLTPDEFIVLPEYQETSLPTHMILQLMKTKDPEKGISHKKDYSFVADVFDGRIGWRRDALLKLGFTEPKFDYGVILAKSLNENIDLDTRRIGYLPARYIVAPVPSSAYFQKPDQ